MTIEDQIPWVDIQVTHHQFVESTSETPRRRLASMTERLSLWEQARAKEAAFKREVSRGLDRPMGEALEMSQERLTLEADMGPLIGIPAIIVLYSCPRLLP